MAASHHLSRRDARRIAVRAQLLAQPRPTDVLDVLRHLTQLQVDFTTAVVPHADLALWSRIGAAYEPRERRSPRGWACAWLARRARSPSHERSPWPSPGARGAQRDGTPAAHRAETGPPGTSRRAQGGLSRAPAGS